MSSKLTKHMSPILLLLLTVNLVCGDTVAPETAGHGYFPMRIGNSWTYKIENYDEYARQSEVIAKEHRGRYEYFVFETRYLQSEHVEYNFYRAGSDGRVFTNRNGRDELYIDFDERLNKTWKSYGEFEGSIVRKNIAAVVPAGEFKECLRVFFNIPQVVDEEQWDVYAPGVGLVEMSSAWITGVKLQSAFVNGVAYPRK